MYYMERGMWESNMALAFNFPDHNELQVEKQVDVSDVNPLFRDSFKTRKFSPSTSKIWPPTTKQKQLMNRQSRPRNFRTLHTVRPRDY